MIHAKKLRQPWPSDSFVFVGLMSDWKCHHGGARTADIEYRSLFYRDYLSATGLVVFDGRRDSDQSVG